KRSLGKQETGGRVAAPIWLRFMERALENEPILDFSVPAGIRFVWINPHTGQRASPGDGGGFLECFRRGTEPAMIVMAQPVNVDPAQPQQVLDYFRDLD